MQPSRRELLVLGLAAACVPPTPPVQATRPTQVALAGALSGERVGPLGLPEGIVRRLDKLMAARKLNATTVTQDATNQAFSTKRSTEQRIDWLAAQSAGAEACLLVEIDAVYDTQIQGRLRWTVEATLTIAEVDHPRDGLRRTVDTAVFLQFLHEREERAAAEAAVSIERAAAGLLDDWLRGRA